MIDIKKFELNKTQIIKLVVPLLIPAAAFFFKDTFISDITEMINERLSGDAGRIETNIDRRHLQFFEELRKAELTDSDGIYNFVSLRNEDFIKKLHNDIAAVSVGSLLNSDNNTGENGELEKPPVVKVSLVFKGQNREYAVVNGQVMKPGDITEDNEEIVKLEKGRVLLRGLWGDRWIDVAY